MALEVVKNDAQKKRDLREEALEAIAFLNRKTGRNFRPVKVNVDFVLARLREGYTLQEVKIVVAIKCRDWLHDEKMNQFLRPSTLFNREKFNQYAGLITGEVIGDDRKPSEEVDIS